MLLFVVLLSILSLNAYATPQIPDILIYGGKEYPIQADFLGEDFKKYPERNPKREDERCSSLWRGYKATFEVEGGKIFLKDIVGNVCYGRATSEIKKVVPKGERLFVNWVSYLVWSGYGGNSEDLYGLASLDGYKMYSFFEVDKGQVLEVRHFDNEAYRKFKEMQYQAFRKTPENEENIKRLLDYYPRTSREEADAIIKTWIPFDSKKFLVPPEKPVPHPQGRPAGKTGVKKRGAAG